MTKKIPTNEEIKIELEAMLRAMPKDPLLEQISVPVVIQPEITTTKPARAMLTYEEYAAEVSMAVQGYKLAIAEVMSADGRENSEAQIIQRRVLAKLAEKYSIHQVWKISGVSQDRIAGAMVRVKDENEWWGQKD